MEGKAVLFKRFADIDLIDLEVSSEDPDEIVNCVKLLGKSWAVSTSRTSAPRNASSSSSGCGLARHSGIPRRPARHRDHRGGGLDQRARSHRARHQDDQARVQRRRRRRHRPASSLLKAIGFTADNIILCDTKGVIYQGRTEGMNQWKSAHAAKTSARTLAQALAGADVLRLSVKGAVTKEMVKSMAPKPIIFAMANPDPEITAEEVAEVRNDAIMATGRSDYPNQINNVLGFPYIFAALDVRATAINMEMKIAAAQALADLARDVPDEVAAAYGARPKYGPEYIIPVPFDPR